MLDSSLLLQFTPQGRAAMINAANTGTNSVLVTEIGVTDQGFVLEPGGEYDQLPGERKRLATFGGMAVAPDVIHVSMRDDSSDNYSLRGLALYLDDGTLLCLYGQTESILEKASKSMMLLSADLTLADMDATQITFGSTEFLNPPATTTVVGVTRLSEPAEAIAGESESIAVTPSALKAYADDRLGADAPSEYMKDLLPCQTQQDLHDALGLKQAATFDVGEGAGLDADLLDGRQGEEYLTQVNDTGGDTGWLRIPTQPGRAELCWRWLHVAHENLDVDDVFTVPLLVAAPNHAVPISWRTNEESLRIHCLGLNGDRTGIRFKLLEGSFSPTFTIHIAYVSV